MITIYFAGATKPEERTCEVFGHPNKDSAGETQFYNTHFRNIEDAWKRVLAEAEAGVSIDTRNVRNALKELEKAKEALIKSTLDLQEAMDNFHEFDNKQPCTSV